MRVALLSLALLGQPLIPVSDKVPVLNVEALCKASVEEDKAMGLTEAQSFSGIAGVGDAAIELVPSADGAGVDDAGSGGLLGRAARQGLCKAYARLHCARCHAIERTGESPFSPAPPFRTLHQRYPVETLGEALAEGINTGHPAMPEFRLDPDEIHDLLSYLKTLE